MTIINNAKFRKIREVVANNKEYAASPQVKIQKENRRYPRPGVGMEALSYCAAMSPLKIPSL